VRLGLSFLQSKEQAAIKLTEMSHTQPINQLFTCDPHWMLFTEDSMHSSFYCFARILYQDDLPS